MTLSMRGALRTFNRGTEDERIALDRIDLDVAERDVVVIIGSNGAGKSTLLNAITGQLALDSGTILIDGEAVERQPEQRRARLIARVAQDPMRGTFPTLTLAENLVLADLRSRPRGLRPALGRARVERFEAVLVRFGLGLEKRLGTRVGTLSGGQRQVLALAMAVLNPPRLLLLDEHTAALDPRTAGLVMAATLRAIADGGLTALMITHNMQQAIDHGNRLLMMDAGRIVLDLDAEHKAAMTVPGLVARFQVADDKLLLQT